MVIPHDAGLQVLELKGIGKEFGAIVRCMASTSASLPAKWLA